MLLWDLSSISWHQLVPPDVSWSLSVSPGTSFYGFDELAHILCLDHCLLFLEHHHLLTVIGTYLPASLLHLKVFR